VPQSALQLDLEDQLCHPLADLSEKMADRSLSFIEKFSVLIMK
jgi:hypothetical protein